jgi:peptidoglycan/LPS O-acetylase OafA/YrhL
MGTLRLILATAVVLNHSGSIFGYWITYGGVAVQIFYMISGFLMALILCEKYGPDQNWLFYSNRFLRIYAPYFIVLAVAVLAALTTIRLTGAPPAGLYALINSEPAFTPLTLFYVLWSNVAIVGQDLAYWLGYKDGTLYFTSAFASSQVPVWYFHVIAPAWTLSLELMFYALAPFLVRRNIIVLLTVYFVSHEAQQLASQHGLNYDPWSYRFFPFELEYFVAGAISYRVYAFARPWIEKNFILTVAVSLTAVASVLAYFHPVVVNHPNTFWQGLFLAMPFLFVVNKAWKLDRVLGDLSYPIYLIHWPVNTLLLDHLASGSSQWRGLSCLAITAALSVLLVLLVEKPLDFIRQRRIRAHVTATSKRDSCEGFESGLKPAQPVVSGRDHIEVGVA